LSIGDTVRNIRKGNITNVITSHIKSVICVSWGNEPSFDNLSISAKILIDMVTEEAKKMAPIPIHIRMLKLKTRPITKPSKKGVIIPNNPLKIPDLPDLFKSEIFVSIPIINKRNIIPIKASSLNSGVF